MASARSLRKHIDRISKRYRPDDPPDTLTKASTYAMLVEQRVDGAERADIRYQLNKLTEDGKITNEEIFALQRMAK